MFKGFARWLWLVFNKKKPSKLDAYATVAGLWFYSGCFFTFGVFILLNGIKGGVVIEYVAGVFMLVFAVLLSFAIARSDKRSGLYDVVHDKAVQQWHKKRQEYGVESVDECVE